MSKLIRRLVEKLFWYYQEKDNWEMKMNVPITAYKLTGEELAEARERWKTQRNISPSPYGVDFFQDL